MYVIHTALSAIGLQSYYQIVDYEIQELEIILTNKQFRIRPVLYSQINYTLMSYLRNDK